MATFSSLFTSLTGPCSIALELALLVVSFKRKLYRQLVFFSAYVVLLAIYDPIDHWIGHYHYSFFSSAAYNYIYWSTQLALSLLRLLTIAEISRRSLRGYPAVWAFGWRLLSGVGVLLLSWTIYSAMLRRHHFRQFISVADQRFELMQAILLLLLFFLGAYYRVRISALFRLILIGICIYSAVEVANSQLFDLKSILAVPIFGYIRRSLSPVSVAIWTYAVWRWGATSNTTPDLISQEKYDKFSPQIHDRLRQLNDKLTDLTGERRK
jgi:hypothetical protein